MHYISNKYMRCWSHFSIVFGGMCSALYFHRIQSQPMKFAQMPGIVKFEGIDCDKGTYHAFMITIKFTAGM